MKCAALAPQHRCLPSQYSDASKEAGDKVNLHKDEFVLRQGQQVLNKRPLEGAQDDSDVNFRHKKKKMFRPPQI